MYTKKSIIVWLVFLILVPALSYSQENINASTRIRKQLSDILSELAVQVDQFERIEKKLDSLEDLDKYRDQKNIIMTSIIATAAISSICEYEVDMGNILLEIKDKNSSNYKKARIESIKLSIQQIQSIQKLIDISNNLLVIDAAYSKLILKQKQVIKNVISILSRSKSISEKAIR